MPTAATRPRRRTSSDPAPMPQSVESDAFACRFVERVAALPGSPTLFNPWAAGTADDAAGNGPAARRQRLARHLSAPVVRHVAVGEAAGYQGARISGIPFTSEALLIDGAIPRLPASVRLSDRARPWSEPSARILWGLLVRYGLAEQTLLWNACPLHPQGRSALSNRAPNAAELQLGLPLLQALADAHPQACFLAIGQRSAQALGRLGIAHRALRHPAYGGKTELEAQLRELVGAGRS